MSKIYVFLVIFINTISAYSQVFEGKIIYQNSYISKSPNVTSEQFDAMMGTIQEYSIKDGMYKSITNGSFFQWQLYIPSENRLYNKMAVSDTLLWSDGYSNPDEAVSYEIKKSQIEILGYKCDALLVKTKTGKTTYYYSDKIKIDSELYENHQYGNWSLMTEQTKSLPLRIEMETPQFTLISTATEVKEMELENIFFDLPAVPTKKSPY